jgi:hypothetical protein
MDPTSVDDTSSSLAYNGTWSSTNTDDPTFVDYFNQTFHSTVEQVHIHMFDLIFVLIR